MSERKTAEVKFRCTPTFKAGLAAAAEAEGISVSQYIENAVQNDIWAKANAQIDGTALMNNAIRELRGLPEGLEPPYVEHLASQLEELVPAPFTGTPTPVEDLLDADDFAVIALDAVPEGTVVVVDGKSDEPAAVIVNVTCGCRPWEFCTHKARA